MMDAKQETRRMPQKIFYPVNLDVENRKCLIIGAGDVAEKKVKSLLAFGARICVVSPKISRFLMALSNAGKITVLKTAYQKKFLKNTFLVLITTDDSRLKLRVARDARFMNVLCHVPDAPVLSSFILPSVLRRGGVLVSVSTNDLSPLLAQRLRRRLGWVVGPEYGQWAKSLGLLKQELSARHMPQKKRQDITQCYLNSLELHHRS